MNTLNRAITARFFNSTDDYDALRQCWSALMNSGRKHELSAAHHILYLALRGKDWRRGFTPITNSRKLANGAFYGWTLFRALRQLHSRADEGLLLAPFEGAVTPQMVEQVRLLFPAVHPFGYGLGPEDFAGGTFPFDAYRLPDDSLDADATRSVTHA